MNLNMFNSSPLNEANKNQMANIILLQGGIDSTLTFDCNFTTHWLLDAHMTTSSQVEGQLQTHAKLIAAFTDIISAGSMLQVGISFQAPYFSSMDASGGELDSHSILEAIFIDKYTIGGALVTHDRFQGGIRDTASIASYYKLSLVYNPTWFKQTATLSAFLKLNQKLQTKIPIFDTQNLGGLLKTSLILDSKFNDKDKGDMRLITHNILNNLNVNPDKLITGGNFKATIYFGESFPIFNKDSHSANLRLNNVLTQSPYVSDVSFAEINLITHSIFSNKNTPIDKIKGEADYRLSYRLFSDFENLSFVRGNYILSARLHEGLSDKDFHTANLRLNLALYNEMNPEINFMDSKDFKANILFESGMINSLDSIGARFKVTLSEPMINTMWLSIRSATDRYSIKTPKGDI